MIAGKNSGAEVPQLIDEDGNPYSLTPEVIKFGDDLTVSIMKDVVVQLEEQKKRLLLNIVQLKEELSEQKKEQADVYYYLNKKLDDNFETIASLEEQLLNEQDDREAAERVYERRIEDLTSKINVDEIRFTTRVQGNNIWHSYSNVMCWWFET